MVFFNYALRKLNAKIVYYGPGLCGKTTNLQWIHDHFEGGQRGKMISLATEGDRTIFFDLLPIDIGSIRGMDVTLQLYTVPGQVHYNSTRQLVLRGADGVVFVADSQRTMRASNAESFENLQENLMLQGIDIKEFPHVLQFNKRDLRDLMNTEELNESLNIFSAPIFEGIATEGIGVQETLEGIVKLVMRNLREKYEPVANAGGPTAPSPMRATGPTAFQAEKPPAEKTGPLAPDFASEIDVPSAEPPAVPPPSFEAPEVPVPAETDEAQVDGADSEFASFQDEDAIATKVYEESEEEVAEFEAKQEVSFEPEDDDVPFAPEAPETEFAIDDSTVEPKETEDLSTDPEIVDESSPAEDVGESMDDLFEAEPPSVQSYVKDVINVGAVGPDKVETAKEPEPPAPDESEAVAAPTATDRFEDRIEAPGPFAPPVTDSADVSEPVATEPAEEPPTTSDDVAVSQRAIQEQMRQAFGASENREALASLSENEPDSEPEPEPEPEPESESGFSEFLDEPPEVQPVVPPNDEPAPEPEIEEPVAAPGTDEPISAAAESDESDESPEEKVPIEAAASKSVVFDQIVVEAPVEEESVVVEEEIDEPDVPEPAIEKPAVEEPEPEEPAAAASPFADDPITMAEPIMVGTGDPFSADDLGDAVIPEVIPQGAPLVASPNAIDVTAEGNQLNLKLKGSGAIAEMGQVRALDIEVPVPGEWVGNQKVTLQFRLTLTPAEDEDE